MAEWTRKLKRNVDEELQKIADKGLNTSNLDNAYKLVIIKEKSCRMEQIEDEMRGGGTSQRGYGRGYSRDGYSNDGRYTMQGEYSKDGYSNGYSNADGMSMDGDYSEARRGQHYVRGHYSRDGMSNAGNMGACKEEMMNFLQMEERNASPRDKEKYRKYMEMLESMEV